MPNRDSAYVTG